MSATFNTLFETELRKLIETTRQDMVAALVSGGGIADYAAYRDRAGYLRALANVEDWCDEIATKIAQA